MGLTIHYSLHAETCAVEEARQHVEQIRGRALDLLFQEVGEVVECAGDERDFDWRVV